MEERYDEGLSKGSIDSITIEKAEIILEQMKTQFVKYLEIKLEQDFSANYHSKRN